MTAKANSALPTAYYVCRVTYWAAIHLSKVGDLTIDVGQDSQEWRWNRPSNDLLNDSLQLSQLMADNRARTKIVFTASIVKSCHMIARQRLFPVE